MQMWRGQPQKFWAFAAQEHVLQEQENLRRHCHLDGAGEIQG